MMCIPMDFFAGDVLAKAQSAAPEDLLGCSSVVTLPFVLEGEDATESPLGTENLVLMDLDLELWTSFSSTTQSPTRMVSYVSCLGLPTRIPRQ